MIMDFGLAVLMAVVVIYGAISLWLGRLWVTAPMIFVLLGALVGEHGLSLLVLPISSEAIKLLSEVTLALLLFADASTLHFNKIKADASLPARLLLIGLPLTVALGALLAHLLHPSFELGLGLLVGAILAPTDAALGLAIFNNPLVPVRIRRALNVESGLNDGIATPLVTLFIALSIGEYESAEAFWLMGAVSELAIGIAVGVAVGIAGGWLYTQSARKGWTTATSQQIGNLALALLAFFASLTLGGNGFIAAFIGGICFGYFSRHHLHVVTEYTEVTGTMFSFIIWLIFGTSLVVPLLREFSAAAFLYALLSLTVIRMLPVIIALSRRHLRWDTQMIMGWFGPRGLASVVFLLMAIEAAEQIGTETETSMVVSMVGWTILLSVFLHGLSALPLAAWYSKRLKSAPPDAPELVEVDELVSRRGRTYTPAGPG
jgi:NhaP-type Na+/H+ or K+/H+ antiporter